MLGSCFRPLLLMSLMRDAAVSFQNFNKESGCCLHISKNLGTWMFFFISLKKVNYGWWSANWLIRIPEDVLRLFSVHLQRTLSIKVPCLFDNLVGSVISW